METLYRDFLLFLKAYASSLIKEGAGKDRFFSFKIFLKMLSFAYGGLVKFRSDLFRVNFLRSKSLPCKSICVGNLVVGGTGKTPVTVYLANFIKRSGLRVAVVSRGYGGSLGNGFCVVSDGKGFFENVFRVGDEPSLIARLLKDVPVLAGKDRFRTGMLAVKKFNPDVIVFDDAFQHLRIRCDLNLVLMDSSLPFGNSGLMLPRGVMREPVSALGRADAVIFTRDNKIHTAFILGDCLPRFSCTLKTVFRQFVAAGSEKICLDFKGKTAVVVSGLADNNQFQRAILKLGFVLKAKVNFSDHYPYDKSDFKRILLLLRRTKAQFIVTTDKDYIKMRGKYRFPIGLLVFGINAEFSGYEFSRFIAGFISS